jgi:hypothetical protein
MAGFVHTKHAVSCETGNLLPDYPGKRPADVGLCLRPSAIPSNPPHPVHFLAIDITTTSPPQLDDDTPTQPQLPATAPDTEPARPAHKPNPITKAHLDSLRLKLTRSQQVNNPEYFQALLDNKIMLLPFTVDPFGGLGTHAHAFLYGTHKDTPNTPPAPPPPNWRDTLRSTHAATHYDQLQHMPDGLLPKATKHYKPPPSTNTGTPMSPHRWAHQSLALNMSTFLAKHILRSLASARRSLHNPTTPVTTTIGVPFPHRVTTTFLDPLPTYFTLAGD